MNVSGGITFGAGLVFAPAPLTTPSVEYLVVAGGGSGAGSTISFQYAAGGGGAGGVLYGTANVIDSTTYSIVIGGGAGPSTLRGSDSTFANLTATGGGRGAVGFAPAAADLKAAAAR